MEGAEVCEVSNPCWLLQELGEGRGAWGVGSREQKEESIEMQMQMPCDLKL